MVQEYLQITIRKHRKPKTKLGYWWYWKIWFPVWYIWRPKVLSKFYYGMSVLFRLILRTLSKSKYEEFVKETEEFDVLIKNMTGEEQFDEVVKKAIIDMDEE
jgi:hypothetical protein